MTNKIQTLTRPQIQARAAAVLASLTGYLHGVTGVEYSAAELSETLRTALIERGAGRAIILWDQRRGLDIAPTLLLGAWAAVLNELAEAPAVAPAVLGNALGHAIRANCGQRGGSVLVWRLAGGLAVHVVGGGG